METKNLADLYDLPTLDWATVTARLDAGFGQAPGSGGPDRHTCWLTTLDADGSPHTTGIGAAWVDGSWWFETGQTTRKGRNVARDPRCTLAVAGRRQRHRPDRRVQRPLRRQAAVARLPGHALSLIHI